MNNLYVYGYSSLRNGALTFNSNVVSETSEKNPEQLLHNLYHSSEISYPKFFKMDLVSKTAFLASEILLRNITDIQDVYPKDIAVLLNSSSGSLHTDLKYQETIRSQEEYYPSPGLFVYTLPNIAIGEICIRNGFKGENLCMISENPDYDNLYFILKNWLKNNMAELVLLCWLNVYEKDLTASVILVGKEKKGEEFTKENLIRITQVI